MEGVAYSQAECVDVFRKMGVPVSGMTVCGGGGQSGLWRQMLADLFCCPVNTLAADEGGALGAALLAAVGAGLYKNVEEAVAAVVKKNPAQAPLPANTAAYKPYFALYKSLYPLLKQSWAALACI